MDYQKLEKDFSYNYFHPYFLVLIKDYNEERINLSIDNLFYNKNGQLRLLHQKFYQNTLSFSDNSIMNIYYRMLLDDCVDYYIGRTYDLYNSYNLDCYLQIKNSKDDINIGKCLKIVDLHEFSKDDIFYYKYKNYYNKILGIPKIHEIMDYS